MKSVYESETELPEPCRSDIQSENTNERGPNAVHRMLSFLKDKITRLGHLFKIFQTKHSLNSTQSQIRTGNIDEDFSFQDIPGIFVDPISSEIKMNNTLFEKVEDKDIVEDLTLLESKANINLTNDFETQIANETKEKQDTFVYDDQPSTSGIKRIFIKSSESDSDFDSDEEKILKTPPLWLYQTLSNISMPCQSNNSISYSMEAPTSSCNSITDRFNQLKSSVNYFNLSLLTAIPISDTTANWIHHAEKFTDKQETDSYTLLGIAENDTASESSIEISHINYEISPELESGRLSGSSAMLCGIKDAYSTQNGHFKPKIIDNFAMIDSIKNVSFAKGTEIFDINSKDTPTRSRKNMHIDKALASYWEEVTSKHDQNAANVDTITQRDSELSTFHDDFFTDLTKRPKKSNKNKPFSTVLNSFTSESSFKIDNEDLLTRPCIVGDVDAVKRLIRTRANIHTRDSMSRTPLHISIFNQYPEVASLLLKHGADPNVRDVFGRTPLHIAVVDRPNLQCARMLFDHGAEVPERSFPGEMGIFLELIQKAVPTEEELILINLLIKNGEIHVNDYSAPAGRQALHYAAMADSGEMIRILLNLGADLNAVNDNGHTPLEAAEFYRCNNAAAVLRIAKNIQDSKSSNRTL